MPETTYVLAAHGSRDPRAQHEAQELAETVRAARPEAGVELAFLERGDPDLASALDRAAQSATHVTLIPLFLNSGSHLHEDLPAVLDAARQRHPGHHFTMAEAVGFDPAVPELLTRRLDEVRCRLPSGELAAVLTAHGARDPRATDEVEHLAEHLVTRSGLCVHTAYSGVGHPGLEEVLGNLAEAGYAGAAVLPHLLFTGRFHDQLLERTAETPLPTAVARPYGPDPALCRAILARLDKKPYTT